MKKKLLILLTLIFMTPFVIKAEELKMDWQKSWGGNGYDGFYDLLQTEDGSYIALLGTVSTDIEGITNKGYEDAIILKYDEDFNLLWQKSWGGNSSDYLNQILLTEDGGFVAIGNTYSTDIVGLTNKGRVDAIIVKFDKEGNMVWQKNWGGSNSEYFYNFIQTNDGGFIAVGHFYSTDIEGITNKGRDDAIIVKYDKDGNLLWQKSWGGNNYDTYLEVLETEDGGLIAFGTSDSTNIDGITIKENVDAMIIKYDKNGNMLWQTSYGAELVQRINSAVIDKKGNLIVCVDTFYIDEGEYYTGEEDSTVISYDKDGKLLWQKNWGGSETDIALKLLATEDNELIVLGWTESTDIEGMTAYGSNDVFILKYSYEYNLENITTENGTSIVEQKGKYGIITPTPDEGYEVDKIIIKDKDGNVLDVETNKQEDGTYSFDLYIDVSVEVIYKEKIENPKTGILDVITILFVGLFISFSGFFIVKRYNERFEF